MMTQENVLLMGVALLAALFFIGGLIDLFSDLRVASRRRRRRRARRPGPPIEIDSQTESEAPALTAHPVIPPMAADLTWPARQPAPEPSALRQAPSGPLATQMSGESAESAHVEEFSHHEMDRSKMVIHYRDGRVIKGYSYDFYPNKPHFHLLPPVAGFSLAAEAIEVRIKDLKAVFFVKDFVDDPSYNERKYFVEGERPPGRKVGVKFRDGEILVGSTVGYEPKRPGFFLIPADPKSNNLRVFVVSTAVTRIRFL